MGRADDVCGVGVASAEGTDGGHAGNTSGPGGGRVLVVDDAPQVRNALARLVRAVGMTPLVAATAEEAQALAEGETLAAVVTDVYMPGIGGVALLQRLSPFQPQTRFIVVTGGEAVQPETLPRGHRVRVFTKPWNERELMEALRGHRMTRLSSLPPPKVEEPVTQVLLVEPNQADADLFRTALRMSGLNDVEMTVARTVAEARGALRRGSFDVMCVELELSDASGIQAVVRLHAEAPHCALVALSHVENPDAALMAVKAGAQDYLVKRRSGPHTMAKSILYARQRKRAELALSEIAFRDQLTGLANRTRFRQRIAESIARAKVDGNRFAVLLLDLDRFKPINDAFGHDAGDTFLIQIAERLKAGVTASDTVARLGGDEFAILLASANTATEVEERARALLSGVAQPLPVGGSRLAPSASIGAALFPASGDDSDELLAAADVAMYVVKGKSRNGVHVHGAELTAAHQRRMRTETALRAALELGEFDLHYQPQVSDTGSLVGAEALLRWRQDGQAPMGAGQFISILEETSMILDLGDWILDEACRQMASWTAGGAAPPRIGINLSAKQFVLQDLPDKIVAAAERWGVPTEHIELELTESVLLDDNRDVERTLMRLSAQGFRLALDDFGTGYCSLAYLRRFPIDTLKIDRSFVTDIDSDGRTRALAGGILQMARRMGLEVVAEGVETDVQRDILAEEQCRVFQGYLFGKAVTADQFSRRYLTPSRSDFSAPCYPVAKPA